MDESLQNATPIRLDESKISPANPFGFSVKENNNDCRLYFKEITKEQQEVERLSAYDYLI